MAQAELVARALRRIEAGGVDAGSIAELAQQLGVTTRHLRRAWRAEFGLSPVQFVQARRLALAKQLVEETTLPMTEIAFASGFQSVRRFNALFARAHGHAPSRLRKSERAHTPRETLLIELAKRTPQEWSALLDSFVARAIPSVECVADGVYCRTVRVDQCVGWIAIYPFARRSILHAEVSLSLAPVLAQVVERARRLVAGAEFDDFEAAVRSLCAFVHDAATARNLCSRLAETFGDAFHERCVPLTRSFPTAAQLSRASAAELARIGVDGEHARSILALVRARQFDSVGHRGLP